MLEMVGEKLMIPNDAPNLVFVALGVQRLPAVLIPRTVLFQGIAIRVLVWVEAFPKAIKTPLQQLLKILGRKPDTG